MSEQAVAELGQTQVKLEVTDEMKLGVEIVDEVGVHLLVGWVGGDGRIKRN